MSLMWKKALNINTEEEHLTFPENNVSENTETSVKALNINTEEEHLTLPENNVSENTETSVKALNINTEEEHLTLPENNVSEHTDTYVKALNINPEEEHLTLQENNVSENTETSVKEWENKQFIQKRKDYQEDEQVILLHEKKRGEYRRGSSKELKPINAVVNIGFTYSASAFSSPDSKNEESKHSLITWDSKERQLEYTSTAILLNQDRSAHSIGFEAEEYFYDELNEEERKDWFFFPALMSTLLETEVINDGNVIIKDKQNRHKMKAVDVIAAFIYQMKSKLDTNLNQECSVEMLTLVVPAILKDKEKRLIKKATEIAGIASDFILLEAPEVVLKFYSSLSPNNKEDVDLVESYSCIVLYVEDTSLTTTLMEVKRLTYNMKTTVFSQYGGISGDLFGFFTSLFTREVTQRLKKEHPFEYVKPLHDFQLQLEHIQGDQKVKIRIPSIWFKLYKEIKDTTIQDAIKKSTYSSHVQFSHDKVRISNELFKKKFINITQNRYKLIANIIHVIDESVSDISVLYLVGEHIDNMLVNDLRERYPNYTIHAIDPKKAILHGALQFWNERLSK
ncbi:uncharacterized protein LOC134697962 [Mytilus trossulus]|uniref:uncharacterized protein LOC134697962 n=1 Tax=Mytilus trossulus TaxID=6551 RepID=UPI003006422B